MKKFVYIYYVSKDSDGSNDQAWGAWFGQLGDKLVDGGNPFNRGGQAVHAGGVMDVHEPVATGYSIIMADDMNQATELAKGCPLMSEKDGAVCVYEALPM
jgi:hypothetical protein